MREIETKYRVADAESVLAALRSAGVAMGDPVLQNDQAYAPAGWTPDRGKIGFTFARVRTQDNTHLFRSPSVRGEGRPV